MPEIVPENSAGILHATRRFARSLGDVVFPPLCVNCAGLVTHDTHTRTTAAGEASAAPHTLRCVCTRCADKIDYAREPCCRTCGHPFYGELTGTRMCEHCEGLAPAFREGRTAVLFKGAARALVHELKYHRSPHVLRDIETILSRAPRVLELARGAVLVPVPLHPRKERERGCNQGRLVAGCIARAAGGGTRVQMLLRRVRDTVSQTALDRASRRANLKNAFALAPGADIKPALHHVIVDDVFTTGSTLNSCAGVLRRAGCLNLDIITFGHG